MNIKRLTACQAWFIVATSTCLLGNRLADGVREVPDLVTEIRRTVDSNEHIDHLIKANPVKVPPRKRVFPFNMYDSLRDQVSSLDV